MHLFHKYLGVPTLGKIWHQMSYLVSYQEFLCFFIREVIEVKNVRSENAIFII